MRKVSGIFQTQNIRLATALVAAGFAPSDVHRRYTVDDEKRFRMRARDLAKMDRGGTISFQFKHTPQLESVVAAYGEQQSNKSDAIELRPEDPDWNITPEERARFAFWVMQQHQAMKDLSKSPDIAMIVDRDGDPVFQPGETIPDANGKEVVISGTLTVPATRMCKDRDHLRKHLGL